MPSPPLKHTHEVNTGAKLQEEAGLSTSVSKKNEKSSPLPPASLDNTVLLTRNGFHTPDQSTTHPLILPESSSHHSTLLHSEPSTNWSKQSKDKGMSRVGGDSTEGPGVCRGKLHNKRPGRGGGALHIIIIEYPRGWGRGMSR